MKLKNVTFDVVTKSEMTRKWKLCIWERIQSMLLRRTKQPTAGSKSVQPYLARTVQQQQIKAEGWVSRPAGCKAARLVRWKARGLGDCHGVAPLLPQSLICPACTRLRAKAGDYLHCTSTPTTHCLLTTQRHALLRILSPSFLPCACIAGHIHAHTHLSEEMTIFLKNINV